MLTEEISVNDIMERLGYENETFFYRLFYKRHRMTPMEYRKKSENDTEGKFVSGSENDIQPSFSYTGYRSAAPAGKRCCLNEKKEVFLWLEKTEARRVW